LISDEFARNVLLGAGLGMDAIAAIFQNSKNLAAKAAAAFNK
jgi:hypothetical protein